MKKIFASILAAALLCGCDSSNKAASTATTSTKSVAIASDTDISSMNSSVATDGTSFQALGLCMAGLVQLDSNGIAQPDLAESWDISDDDLLAKTEVTDAVDSAKRWEDFAEAEKLLVSEDVAIVPLYQAGNTALQNPKLTGIDYHAAGVTSYRHLLLAE